MRAKTSRLLGSIPALIAVGTLPVAILAWFTVGVSAAVFVVLFCWVGLLPLSGVLIEEVLGIDGDQHDPVVDERRPASPDESATDPVEVLRERYARGEIDDEAFERGLETLLESEGSDPETILERRRNRSEPGDRKIERETS
ncbi:SHOCT domain-containing protein [Saliphagus sp. GCM10025334]